MNKRKPARRKPRPEFVAWENHLLAQIAVHDSGIKALTNEIKATRVLRRSLKSLLASGRRSEARLEQRRK